MECPLRELRRKVRLKRPADFIHPREQPVVGRVQHRLGIALLNDGSCPIDKAPEPRIARDHFVERGTAGQLRAFAQPARQTSRHLASLDSSLVFSGEQVVLQSVDGRDEFFGVASGCRSRLFRLGEDAGKLTHPLLEANRREVALRRCFRDFEFREQRIEPAQDCRNQRTRTGSLAE